VTSTPDEQPREQYEHGFQVPRPSRGAAVFRFSLVRIGHVGHACSRHDIWLVGYRATRGNSAMHDRGVVEESVPTVAGG
jgi:hypothetical protein